MGSKSDGCALKSLAIKDKKITVEQFGRCSKESNDKKRNVYSCKFCVKDLARSTYFINNTKLIEESRSTAEEPERDIVNYSAEVNINE